MVHRKYTYKRGKRFGPYYYETKRVNGKVVTTYLGRKLPHHHPHMLDRRKRYSFFALSSVLVVFLLFLAFTFGYFIGITGRASLDIETSYLSGELLNGSLQVKLKQGELVPSDSRVIVTLGTSTETRFLSELVNVSASSGKFYVEGLELEGKGDGYGLAGESFIEPNVSFELRVYYKSQEAQEDGESDEGADSDNEGSESSDENEEESNESSENEGENGELEEPESEDSDEVEEEPEESEGESVEPEEESESEESDEPETETEEESEEGEEESESEESDEPETGSGITGEVIAEDDFIVSGTVGSGSYFEYNLEEGQTAEIVEGSVEYYGGELSNDEIDLDISDGIASVQTSFSLVEEGFGEEFLDDAEYTLEIDLEEFGLVVENSSDLSISLFYDSNILAEVSRDISVSDETEEDILLNETNTSTVVNVTNQTVFLNGTNISVNVSVNTTQFGAVLGQPVKWVKKVAADSNVSNLSIAIEIPEGADNISIKKKIESEDEEIIEIEEIETDIDEEEVDVVISVDGGVLTGHVISDGFRKSRTQWFNRFLRFTGFTVSEEEVREVLVEVEENVEEVEVEYYTDAPYALETDTFSGKEVKIVGPDNVHYENVLAFTVLSESLNVLSKESVRIHWREGGVLLDSSVFDKDGNGVYDYVEWVVPHLSNQTFDIIVIVKAEHLDENRTFISDIYEEARELDGNWTEVIPDGDYVRVVFEVNLTSDRDITVYPSLINGTPQIEVYEVNGTETIAQFESLDNGTYNTVFLDGLFGSQDTFDLRIVSGEVQFDHIIDPIGEFFEDCNSISEWDVGSCWAVSSGECNCTGGAGQALAQNMSYASVNATGVDALNLTFSYTTASFSTLKVYANSSTEGFTEVFSVGESSSGTTEIDLGKNITLQEGVSIRGTCISVAFRPYTCTWDNINITSYLDVENTNITSCTSLPTSGQNYTIISDLMANGTCLQVLGDDISINGQGYSIIGDDSSGHYGINATGRSSVEVYNVNITDFETSIGIESISSSADGGTLQLNGSQVEVIKTHGSNNGGADATSGGDITMFDSNFSIIEAWGGRVTFGFTAGDGGNGGDVLVFGGDVNLTRITINATGGDGINGGTNGVAGRLTINYSGIFVDERSNYSSDIYLTVVNDSSGEISWHDELDASEISNLSDYLLISDNFFEVDSNTLTGLNSSANISFYGTPGGEFAIPALYRNDILCETVCYNLTALTASVVDINVTHWTNYTIGNKANIDACGVLDVPNVVYNLINNISTTEDCFEITADNVTLDGNGNNITGDDGFFDIGVNVTDQINVTVRNLIISDFADGMSVLGTNESFLINNVVLDNSDGIYMESSYSNNLSLNNLTDNSLPINLLNSDFNIVENSYLGQNSLSLFVSSSDYNNITNNTIDSGAGNGIQISNGNFNFVFNNSIINSGGFSLSITGAFNNYYGNVIQSSQDSAIRVGTGSQNSTITAGVINNSNQDAIFFTGDDIKNLSFDGVVIDETNVSYFDILFNTAGAEEIVFRDMAYGNYTFNSSLVIFEDSSFGEIVFLEALNGSGTNLSNDIRIRNNSLDVETGNNVGLNVSANISLYNSPGAGIVFPDLLRDGSLCGNVCYNFTALDASTVSFNVSHWTNYRIGDVTGPLVSINLPVNTTLLFNDFDLFFNVTLNENGSVSYSLDGGINNVSMVGDEGDIFGFHFNGTNSSIADGTYTFSVYANDTSGNNNYSESVVFSVDTQPFVEFVDPTPLNGSNQTELNIFVNLSSSDPTSLNHYGFVEFDSDLLLWMRFDDVNTSNDPLDLSSFSNNGTLVNEALINETGYFANATHLDGTDDYIDLGLSEHIGALTSGFSISAWINPSDLTGLHRIVAHSRENSANGIGFGTNGDELRFTTFNIHDYDTSTLSIALDTWQHVAVVMNESFDVDFYVNGTLLESETHTAAGNASTDDDFFVGTTTSIGSSTLIAPFQGVIDDLLIFNRSLTEAEIGALYNSTLHSYFNNFTDLELRDYLFTGYAVDTKGNINQTNERFVFIISDKIEPNLTFVTPTPDDQSAQENFDIFVNLSSSDADSDHYAFVDFNEDLLFWIRADFVNDSGDPIDVSNHINGTLADDSFINASGYWGNTIWFDGNDDYVEIVNSTSAGVFSDLGNQSNYSISAWIKTSAAVSNDEANWRPEDIIIELRKEGVSSAISPFSFGLENGSLSLGRTDDHTTGSERIQGTTTINDGEWHHVVASVSNNSLELYVDGVLDVQGNYTIAADDNSVGDSDSNMQIGIRSLDDGTKNSNEFDGAIDEIMIFNRSLESVEVLSLFNATVNQYYHNHTDLEYGSYSFTGYAIDQAGNNNQTTRRVLIADLTEPNLTFVAPTPENGSTQVNHDIFVNLSSSDADSDHYAFVDFNEDLLFWMRFDDVNGSLDPVDLSGHLNGTLVADSLINDSGYWGNSSWYDGDDDYVDLINSTSTDIFSDLGNQSNYSISAWIKTSAAVSNDEANWRPEDIIIELRKEGVSSAISPFSFGLENGSLSLGRTDDHTTGSERIQGTTTINDGEWHHVVASVSNNSLELYVDGVLDVQGNYTIAADDNSVGDSDSNMQIGIRSLDDGTKNSNEFDGAIDEIMIFNRSLESVEVLSLFNATVNQYYHNHTDLNDQKYLFTGYVIDTFGNKNETSREVTVNEIPTDPTPVINSTDHSNQTAQDLHCSDTLLDSDADRMNVTVWWYNSSTSELKLNYNSSFVNGTDFHAVLNSANTTKGENWTCGLRYFDGDDYSEQVNSSNLRILNTPPSIPSPISPADGSQGTDRTPAFDWSDSSDDDDDTLTYEINVTLNAASTCTDPDRHITGISGSAHTLVGDLLCFIDNNDYYNWSVIADDGEEKSSWSTIFSFNISAVVDISLPTSAVEFGSINLLASNDTVNDSPPPLVIRNDGNAIVNVTLSATDLWLTIANPTSNYRFKFDNVSGEEGAFNPLTTTDFTNVPSSDTIHLIELNYSDDTDSAEIDLNITVPGGEPPSVRNSTVTVISSLAEG